MFPRWVWDFIRSTTGDGGYAEVRGWRFDYVAPRYRVRPSVSDVASPCPTRRDVYLRRVLKVSVDSPLLRLGRAVHEVFLLPFRLRGRDVESVVREFRRLLRGFSEFKDKWGLLESVFRRALALSMASEEDQIPVAVEPYVPGGAVGLSDFVRPDFLVGFVPVDIVLSSGSQGVERKELALAGYALAIEAWTGFPVDVGVVVAVQLNGDARLQWRVVRIDDSLRRRFLEARDEVARMVEYGEDPGRAPQCPRWCPFREVCEK